ncbi:hypothetical protein CAEBREN_04623 [Caenorhabditis brenneri]|uniref:CUB-like domain-containing protein n=1 Tax=Caenorhabditis brenneri TaxID=135651 RepID=G0N6I6_CAEBE|nr:hypothetical protein CAEBREN_04623 [Caenorhabditis brenneri]
MSRLFFFFLVSLSSSISASPLVLQINKYYSHVQSSIENVEVSNLKMFVFEKEYFQAGARLFLASYDENVYLKNIQVQTGGRKISLDQLNDFNDDGTPKSITIAADLLITTTNPDAVTTYLNGYLYVTTKLQAEDSTFSVYVIKNSHTISTTGTKSTVVVLNTKLQVNTDPDEPSKTSYVTNINQSPNTNLYFQWGIPAANWNEITNNTFFMNPIDLPTKHFFDHVEPLQVGLDYWYFTSFGPVNMQLENKYVSNHVYTTTAVSTTGLIVNDFIFKEHVVNFQTDKSRTGTSGTFTSAFIDSSDLMIFMKYDSSSFKNEFNRSSEVGNLSWTIAQPNKLTINSTSSLPGTFYCQYFTFTGGLLPVTIPPTTISPSPTVTKKSTVVSTISTTPLITTTKGSSFLFLSKLLAIVLATLMY